MNPGILSVASITSQQIQSNLPEQTWSSGNDIHGGNYDNSVSLLQQPPNRITSPHLQQDEDDLTPAIEADDLFTGYAPPQPPRTQEDHTFSTDDDLLPTSIPCASNHYMVDLRMFCCPICHVMIAQKGKFKEHYITHTGFKGFECTICGRRFSRKSSLKRHKATICTGPATPMPDHQLN